MQDPTQKTTYILAIDQGTTGSTALVVQYGDQGEETILASVNETFPQHYPKNGWVEHDLNDIWQSVEAACRGAFALAAERAPAFSTEKLCAIGITNQRETLCIYDRQTLTPLRRAIVWQCRRSSSICRQLTTDGLADTVTKKTGLYLDPYFTGTKIRWVIENEPAVASALTKGTAILGTIDTFLLSRLTGGKSHATEGSNASRTLLYSLHDGGWDPELMRLMGLENDQALPAIQDSASLFGHTKDVGFLPDGIPITGMLGDQQAALAGQGCFEAGQAKCTYGTGAFVLLNIGPTPRLSQHKLLTTVAWQLNGKRTYALEGASFIAGAAIQFLRDNLNVFPASADSAGMAAQAKAAPDLYFVPAFVGLGAPYWQPDARGALLGLSRATTKNDITRACLEGVAFQVADLLDAMKQDAGCAMNILRVDGGAAQNLVLREVQANISQVRIEWPHTMECTGLGAARMAAIGKSLRQTKDFAQTASLASLEPTIDSAESQSMRVGWQRAVRAVEVFATQR
jgi:glycerol kinase